jgi:hypothetical protein
MNEGRIQDRSSDKRHCNTGQHRKPQTNIHALSGIRSREPSCLRIWRIRPHGHRCRNFLVLFKKMSSILNFMLRIEIGLRLHFVELLHLRGFGHKTVGIIESPCLFVIGEWQQALLSQRFAFGVTCNEVSRKIAFDLLRCSGVVLF